MDKNQIIANIHRINSEIKQLNHGITQVLNNQACVHAISLRKGELNYELAGLKKKCKEMGWKYEVA